MKIKLHRIVGRPHGYLTVGYWFFDKPNNKGTLHIEFSALPDWRFSLAVIGHELIESIYCWVFGIKTEECDKFDDWAEIEYDSGRMPETFEAGFHKKCPYRVGHVLGSWFEWVAIHGTFASWTAYDEACNSAMGINAPADVKSPHA